MKNIPYIEGKGKQASLIVNGKPFVALGGEIHNSSSSSLDYMENTVWPALRPLGLNTVVVPTYWECIEPEQGVFDFMLIDGIIEQARREKVKIVFLWFGLWKNGESYYVPAWVKTDTETYFRVRTEAEMSTDCVSPLCEAGVQGDVAAFRKLMVHIREFDSEQSTVIMMQVENEMGVLGSARDFSAYAEDKFNETIPAELATHFGKSGTWEEVFGTDSCEYFMAYYYATAIEKIIVAGSAEYPIPMYVNAWLEQFPKIPGYYPCGGPVAKIMGLWRLCAPSISLYAPDIYVDNFRDVCDEYAVDGNPLFIPEVRPTTDAAAFLFYAIGKHNAMGFSPFSIEDMYADTINILENDELQALNINPMAFGINSYTGPMLKSAYSIVANMNEIIYKAHKENLIHGFLEYNDSGVIIPVKNYMIKVIYNGKGGWGYNNAAKEEGSSVSGGFIIELENDEFIFAGMGYCVEFLPKTGEKSIVSVLHKEEGVFEHNSWKRGRILNGDEQMILRLNSIPSTVKIQLYRHV